VGWIEGSLRGALSSLCINGRKTPPFFIKRSIRQGCPISPVLLSLSTQVLCTMLDNGFLKGEIHGIKIPGVPQQLCVQLFADDSLALIQASLHDWNGVMNIFSKFCKFMGVEINIAKTLVSWASDSTRHVWAMALPWSWCLSD